MYAFIAFIAWALLLNTVAATAHNHDDHHDHDDHDQHGSHNHVRRLASNGGVERCGTVDPTPVEAQAASNVVAKYMAKKLMAQKSGRQAATSIEVDTYFHVITNGTEGLLTNEQLLMQLQVLNNSYSPQGITFRLIGNTTTDNAVWFTADRDGEVAMKEALRLGDSSTLNIYFKGGAVLGRATLPWLYSSAPKADGVVVSYTTIPMGSEVAFNEGKTLVHETGHWFGLYHTFQQDLGTFANLNQILILLRIRNICNFGKGDEVDDTPTMRGPTLGCPTTPTDTCPRKPGVDMSNNFMDYSDDRCLTAFTPGQRDRIMAMWQEYRAVSA